MPFFANGNANHTSGIYLGKKDPSMCRMGSIAEQIRRSLPIASAEKRIAEEVRKNDILIIVGETGSGKITRDCRRPNGADPSIISSVSEKPEIFNELVETNHSYIRYLTRIDPLWLPELAPQFYPAQI